jgi:hypothetical protein
MINKDPYLQPENPVVMSKLKRLVKPIGLEMGQEGYRNLVLGGRAGPYSGLSNLLHEVSHFVEIDDARCTKNNFGFRYGKWIACPISARGGWYQPSTNQAIMREIRTFVIQYRLMDYLEVELIHLSFQNYEDVTGYVSVDFQLTTLRKLLTVLQYMPDFGCLIPGSGFSDKIKYCEIRAMEMLGQPRFQLHNIFRELRNKRRLVQQHLNAPTTEQY